MINELFTVTPITATATQWFYRSVFSPLNVGTASYTMIGSEICNPMLKAKFTWAINWNAIRDGDSSRYGSIGLNVFLVASNEQSTNTSVALYPDSTFGINNWFYQNSGYNPTLNGSNVKVLKKWHRQISPDQLSTAPLVGFNIVTGKLKYRWRKKIHFEDAASVPDIGGPASTRVVRGWNYYLLVGYRISNALGPSVGANYPTCSMDSFLYYKDP